MKHKKFKELDSGRAGITICALWVQKPSSWNLLILLLNKNNNIIET